MPTETYDTVGNHSLTLPSYAEDIIIEVWGAKGGDQDEPTGNDATDPDSWSDGGLGGYAKATFADPTALGGTALDINVGAWPGTGASQGGGMSDVRTGGTTLADQVMVAGGGGGGAQAYADISNGVASATAGAPGGANTGGTAADTTADGVSVEGGHGGDQSAGGSAGGATSPFQSDSGSAGTRGSGGGGGSTDRGTAGHGGDGYYGGGGGGAGEDPDGEISVEDAAAAGGGGGSNFIDASGTNTTNTQGVDASNGGDGKVVVQWTEESPDSVTATAVGRHQVDLSWTDTAADEDGVKIERSDDGGSTWATAGTVGTDVTSFSDTGLTSGTTYTYRVRYTDSVVGDGPVSNTDTATTDPPEAPSDLSASTNDSDPESAIDLQWTVNSVDETGFEIQQSRGDNPTQTPFTAPTASDWTAAATTGPTETRHVVTGLLNGERYTFRIRATGEDADSEWVTLATGDGGGGGGGGASGTASFGTASFGSASYAGGS